MKAARARPEMMVAQRMLIECTLWMKCEWGVRPGETSLQTYSKRVTRVKIGDAEERYEVNEN